MAFVFPREGHFRAAIVLNNVGSQLLANHCYRQAHEALQDAVYAAREATSENAVARHAESSSFVKLMLQNASQKLASACQELSVLSSPTIHVEHISDDDDATFQASFWAGILAAPMEGYARPIIIDDANQSGASCFGVGAAEPELLVATILYNFGLAYVCLSKTSLCRNRAGRLRRRAIQLFSHSWALQKRRRRFDAELGMRPAHRYPRPGIAEVGLHRFRQACRRLVVRR